MILEEEPELRGREIVLVMTVTVVMSVIAHGTTAAALSARYGRWSTKLRNAPELGDAAEHATRLPYEEPPPARTSPASPEPPSGTETSLS